ncbi:MAG: alpha/beta fold hydrolase [Ardenticatenia bacterium]|nr:alpha/beta fold hydrolase [Ardenticatenia bacterium]
MPRLQPLMLIHGFGGHPDLWTNTGFFQTLVRLADVDPDLIHRFHYGWDEDGAYNAYEDIRRLAARLTTRPAPHPEDARSQVRRLSEKSRARGGQVEVIIIAFSMGGLIARYWMSRRQPDQFGTLFDAPVKALITVGTPHLGVSLAEVTDLLPHHHWRRWLLRAVEWLPFPRGQPVTLLRLWQGRLAAMQRRAIGELLSDLPGVDLIASPALRQLQPDSDFLRRLNRADQWPTGVEAALLWGEIRLAVRITWKQYTLWSDTINLGDLVVSARSASTLVGAPVRRRRALVNETEIAVPLDRVDDLVMPEATVLDLSELLPPEQHNNLLKQEDVHRTVAQWVVELSATSPQ